MAPISSMTEGRFSISILHVNIGAGSQQLFDNFFTAHISSKNESRVSIVILHVNIGTCNQ